MKTIFMGTPEFAIPSLEVVFKNTDLQLIFTKEDKINARGNKIIFSPVKQFGIDNDIEIIQPKKMKDEEVINKIKEINPDLIVVVAYGKILPKEIIDIPKYGIINVHSSLLPKYRGASPIHSAILNGDTETGVSIMYIEEGLDSGDVILKEYCEITEDDTLGTLHNKLKDLGAAGLIKALKLIENGEVRAEKQDDNKATLVKPITKEQAKIDWNNTKEVIYNQIRGLNPFPAAHTSNEKGENIKIYKSEKIDKNYKDENGTEIENGTIVEIINKKGPVVKVANGGILILEAKFEGKKLQKGVDIINGRKMVIGEKLLYSNSSSK